MNTVPVGIFQYVDYDGRWYVGAEWHYATDTDTPTRIVQVDESTATDMVEALFSGNGYDTEASAVEAIQACAF